MGTITSNETHKLNDLSVLNFDAGMNPLYVITLNEMLTNTSSLVLWFR